MCNATRDCSRRAKRFADGGIKAPRESRLWAIGNVDGRVKLLSREEEGGLDFFNERAARLNTGCT